MTVPRRTIRNAPCGRRVSHSRASELARRVVITGIGAVTPLGIGVAPLWEGVRCDRSAVREVTRFDASALPTRVAAEVPGFVPGDFLRGAKAGRLDRFAQFSVAASRLALDDAGLDPSAPAVRRAAIYIGSALGGIAFGEQQHRAYLEGGLRAVDPLLALTVFGGASTSNVAIELGIRGPAVANANSCASGAIAIGEAFHLIQRGAVELALAGGAEAPLAPLTFGAFALIKAMSRRNRDPEHASRPFDRARDGFVMAEGAAVLVLEERDRARSRGAHIYAEVVGYGVTNDAHHMTAPLPSGLEASRAIRAALAAARVAPEEVGYVNAHASSTPLGDRAEARAIHNALGAHGRRVLVSGTKGHHAHALGATGAIEAAICALALQRGYLPATANLTDPDPALELRHVPAGGETRAVHYALSNAFGFGGVNAALLLRQAGR